MRACPITSTLLSLAAPVSRRCDLQVKVTELVPFLVQRTMTQTKRKQNLSFAMATI
jgi:hypothetical protein